MTMFIHLYYCFCVLSRHIVFYLLLSEMRIPAVAVLGLFMNLTVQEKTISNNQQQLTQKGQWIYMGL